MQALPAIQTLLLLLLLLAGVVLPTEATKEGGTSANTTLQAQSGRHHVQKVSHTHIVDGIDGCSCWPYRPVHSRLISISTLLCSVSHELFQLGTICQPSNGIRFNSPSSLSYCDCLCHCGTHCHCDVYSMVGSQWWPQYVTCCVTNERVTYIHTYPRHYCFCQNETGA